MDGGATGATKSVLPMFFLLCALWRTFRFPPIASFPFFSFSLSGDVDWLFAPSSLFVGNIPTSNGWEDFVDAREPSGNGPVGARPPSPEKSGSRRPSRP